MRVQADRDVCIQAGNCVMVADAVFDQDDDGVVVLLAPDVPAAEEDNARQAVDICPASVLRLV